MKKRSLVILLLMIPMLPAVTIFHMAAPVEAWGLQTHMFIVEQATDQLTNQSWADAFEYYSPEVSGGSTTPDQAWQDWDNHLYYPETGEYNAPWAAAKWFDYARGNFTAAGVAEGETADELWETGFFSAGVMSHYASDPCIPVHTDDVEDGIPDEAWPGHGAYEGEINEKVDFLDITITDPETEITNVTDLVIDCAVYSHQFFDLIADAYPTSESTALSNSSVLAATEDCLSLAVTSIAQLFYTLTLGIDAPNVTITYDYEAMFDYAHSNDYIDGGLTSANQTLVRNHLKMLTQESSFTSGDLTDIDLLVITCGFDTFSSSELTAINTWASSGEKGMIITGRGDFSETTDIATCNQVLSSISSNIRMNDDNVYMQGTYQPWYNDLTEIPDETETVGLTEDVLSITMFSPASLYFIDEGPVLPIVYADPTGYQTDQTSPDLNVIYDDSQDGINGNQIPLMAVEEIGDLRLLVAGTTFFSDFDYGKTQFDNVDLFDNFLTWALGNRSENVVPDQDEMGPVIGEVIFNPETPQPNGNLTLSVTVTDGTGVDNVSLQYRIDDVIYIVEMDNIAGDTYSVTLTVPSQTEGSLSFTITTYDTVDNVAIRTPIDIVWGESVTSSTTSTGPPPFDTTVLLIAGVAGVIVVFLIVILVMKKR